MANQRDTRIRSSVLPAWPDCPRRSAAKVFRREVTRAGFELRELPPSIGAAVGTAVHKAAEVMLQGQLDGGELATVESGVEQAMVGFREEIEPGAIWDDTTPNLNAAQSQIVGLARVYRAHLAKEPPPLAVELSLEANAGDGFILTGHIDRVRVDGAVRDLKTGSVDRPYYQQLGAYALLVRSNKVVEVTSIGADWVKRVGLRSVQPPVDVREYAVAACQRSALEVLEDIKRSVGLFRQFGRASAFSCNPMSMMCSDKYCPAWGTGFCEISKGVV